MNVILCNGSLKGQKSASGLIIRSLQKRLSGQTPVKELNLGKGPFQEVLEADALVFVSPLYADALPSHTVRALRALEALFHKSPEKCRLVYAVVNSGFYEGRQNRLALEMFRCWSIRAGLTWGQGVGVGGGPMLTAIETIPEGHGPGKNFTQAMDILSQNIQAGAGGEDLLIDPNFPRILYKAAAEIGWRKQAAGNGLRKKDLNRKPGE